MQKYAVTYTLLMISSFSIVVAAGASHVARQTIPISQPPQTTPRQTIPPTDPITTPTRPPVPPTTPPITTPDLTTPPVVSPTLVASSVPITSTPPSSVVEPTPTSTILPPESVASTSTDAAGQVQTVTVAASADVSSAAPSATQTSSSDNSIKPGTIIGLSVAGGIAAIAVIAFVIWKLTRKRFSDLDDPDEAIKWPELNRDQRSDGDGLSRRPSNSYSNAPSRNASNADQSEYADPYAVPSLPQFNPNQPYRDDPGASGYYDPYRGPVPQTFNDESADGHESIPMSTYPPGARTRSPGPGPSYDMGGRGSPAPGRASPAPGAMYDAGGRGSPAPGRTISPGPAAVLGLDRRPSPGPQYAYGGQPEMTSRTKSPGPNMLG